jgi:bisphosphoglycerate-dependent phosphoglycerate mutase
MTITQTNLVLLRHGISYTNEGKANVNTEQQNILSRTGLRRTIEKAEAFRLANQELHFDHVIISPYQRAVQTGLNFLTSFENKPIDPIFEIEFRERNFGFDYFIGIPQLISIHGKEVVASWDNNLHIRPNPAGETQAEVYARVIKKYTECVMPKLIDGEKVLIVSHCYVLKALMAYLGSGNSNNMMAIKPKNATPYSYSV